VRGYYVVYQCVYACIDACLQRCMHGRMHLLHTHAQHNSRTHSCHTFVRTGTGLHRPASANARPCAHRHPHRQADSRTGSGRGRGRGRGRGTVEAAAGIEALAADEAVPGAPRSGHAAAKHTKAAVRHMPAIRRRFLAPTGLRLPKTPTTLNGTPVARAHTHA
jgi:hypothetical protein